MCTKRKTFISCVLSVIILKCFAFNGVTKLKTKVVHNKEGIQSDKVCH